MDCFFCKGSLKDSFTTHVVDLKKSVIIVRDVPCTECTQCGETVISMAVNRQLEKIYESIKSIKTEIAILTFDSDVA